MTGTATVRATVAGSSNNLNLNSDWSKRRDDLKLVERNREFTLYGFDPKLMGQQAEKVFGKVKPLLSPTELFKQLDKECDEIKELEAPEAVKRALLKEKSKGDREGVDASQIILASSDGISAAEYQDGDRALEEKVEPLTENEKTSVALFQKCSLLKEQLKEAREEGQRFIRCDRKMIGDERFSDHEMAINSASVLILMERYKRSKGDFYRQELLNAKDLLSQALLPKEREKCQLTIDRYGEKMMKANRISNTMISEYQRRLNAVQLAHDNFLRDEKITTSVDVVNGQIVKRKMTETQAEEISRLLGPLEHMRGLYKKAHEKYTRDLYLCNLPGGKAFEQELQENLEKFEEIQRDINKIASNILMKRSVEIGGKKHRHLSPEYQNLILSGEVLNLKKEDFSQGDLIDIAKSNQTTLNAVESIIDWRTVHFPQHFRELATAYSEDFFKRAQPPSGFWDKSTNLVARYFRFGEEDSSLIKELSDEELKQCRTEFHLPSNQGLIPITNLERILGIWQDGRQVVSPHSINYFVDSWCPKSGMLANTFKSSQSDKIGDSFFVGEGTSEELKSQWIKGLKTVISFTPGINSTASGSHADCESLRKKLDIPVGIACANSSNGVFVDLVAACHLQYHSNYLSQASLATRQAMMSYFNINPAGQMVHFCHSNGAMHSLLALKTLPKEMTDRITVVAIGPQCLIPDSMCRRVYHIGSELDLIYKIARINKKIHETYTNIDVEPSNILRDNDHIIRSLTCNEKILKLIKIIKEAINANH